MKKRCIKSLSIAVMFMLCINTVCFAGNYYAMIAHKSKNNNYLIRLIKCSNETICKQVLEIKSIDLDSNWKFAEGECLSGKQYDSMYRAVFNKQPVSEPYIYFIDENNLPTVLKFMDISPFLVDIMINKWAKALKNQGAKGITIIRAK
ncbi:MAG: hypothetical protein P9M13_07865 [Candidatus Ancaeobacter aquaticus]|nr:hypothetical protein [Candidatus Ancaeobacter aquaticus]